MIENIKQILFEDKTQLVKVLENLGCHKINSHLYKEIRCALPLSFDGNTGTSVQVVLSEYIPVYVHSRGGYDDYEIKDIISFVQFILKCGFNSAVAWLCKEIGVEYDENSIIIRNQSETIKCLKQYVKKSRDVIYNEPINEAILNQFPLYIIQEWIDEGISAEIQTLIGIRIDEKRCRWLIPIRDENNVLVAIKGRTYLPNNKELDIPKYIYYKEDKNIKYFNNILFGLNHNHKNIKELNEVILFEGEKSVMKAMSMGIYNTVAIGKDGINPLIKSKILQLHVNVVLMLDKDVLKNDVIKECKKLSMFTNTYYSVDDGNLLDKICKDSPIDRGFATFLELYDNKKRM